jgi:hypothetical protein
MGINALFQIGRSFFWGGDTIGDALIDISNDNAKFVTTGAHTGNEQIPSNAYTLP